MFKIDIPALQFRFAGRNGAAIAVAALLILAVGRAQTSPANVAPPPPPPPPPPAAIQTSTARGTPGGINNRAPLDYHDDTAQSRLLVLQSALKTALEALHQAPVDPQGGFVESAIAQLNQAQTETDRALAYVKAHPEIDPLPAIPTRVGMPRVSIGGGVGPRSSANAYPTLSLATRALSPAFTNFIDGPYPGASAVIGDLGGSRDKIIKNISLASADLQAGMNALVRAANGTARGVRRGVSAAQPAVNPATDQTNPPPPSAPPSPSPALPAVAAPFHFVVSAAGPSNAQPGAITGTVADGDGLASNALVTLRFLDNVTSLPAAGSRGPAANASVPTFPATITNEAGAFTIKDLPPGFYGITASRGFDGGYNQSSTQQYIEVKAGLETALAAPIMFR